MNSGIIDWLIFYNNCIIFGTSGGGRAKHGGQHTNKVGPGDLVKTLGKLNTDAWQQLQVPGQELIETTKDSVLIQ